MLNIIVACGSGVATSTIAAEEIKNVVEDMGIRDYKITKCSMHELPSFVNEADLVLTTNNYRGQLDKPYMSVMGFVSGINEEKVKKDLQALIQKIYPDSHLKG